MNKNIKNIIFDLGDVIIDLLSPQELNDIYFPEHFSSDKFEQKRNQGVFESFELGLMDRGTFLDHLRDCSHLQLEDSALVDLWNKILKSIPIERLELISRLSKNYRTFLLSNTNEIHLEKISVDLEKSNQLSTFQEIFEKAFYSHIIHLRKPETDIYNYVLKEANLIPEETLFLDDKPKNLEPAQHLGIQTILISSEYEMLEALANF